MRRSVRRVSLLVFATMIMVAMFLPAGTAYAGGPGVWTKLAVTDSGGNQVGMLRLADGKLHLVWRKTLPSNKLAFGTSTISLAGSLLATGTALSGWNVLEGDPRLVPDGNGGIRLVFIGGFNDDAGNYYSRGSVYNETSANGSSWTLELSTLAQHTNINLGLGATTKADATPVAAFGLNSVLNYHVGLDAASPASAPDGDVSGQIGSGLFSNALATDDDGSVWMAWFQRFESKQGYWVDRILPSEGTPVKAPNSGNTLQDNEPRQQVAFAARPGGGVYMAYCQPSSTKACAQIDLWKVGASTAKVVPGSGTGNAALVAIAAGPAGRISVAWYDTGQQVIHAVRTNTTVTQWGVNRTVKPPPNTLTFSGLQAEGSSGRLDLIVNAQLTTSGNPITLWHTQILPGLTLTANPIKFSHVGAHTVTFTVKDAGQPVSGVKVSCLGKTGNTNSSGQVKLTYPNGTAKGKHVATASSTDYNPGKVTITVT